MSIVFVFVFIYNVVKFCIFLPEEYRYSNTQDNEVYVKSEERICEFICGNLDLCSNSLLDIVKNNWFHRIFENFLVCKCQYQLMT